jgi:hypothetical protein
MKTIDLYPWEYRRLPTAKAKAREPFFGPSAFIYVSLLFWSFPISAYVQFVVTGTWPYWLQ